MSYKVGQVVKVIANRNGHYFKIGEKVRIEIMDGNEVCSANSLDGEERWLIGNKDIEEIKEVTYGIQGRASS